MISLSMICLFDEIKKGHRRICVVTLLSVYIFFYV